MQHSPANAENCWLVHWLVSLAYDDLHVTGRIAILSEHSLHAILMQPACLFLLLRACNQTPCQGAAVYVCASQCICLQYVNSRTTIIPLVICGSTPYFAQRLTCTAMLDSSTLYAGAPAAVDQGLFANLHAYVQINPQLAPIAERLQLKRLVPMAVDQAIVEIITPVVERSVTIACMTAQELIVKVSWHASCITTLW